jgi:TetR/AcrR family transcriptional regulator, mexCD-oprJ operon repressor
MTVAEASSRRRSGGRRADAQRSVDAILDAALACLVEDPNANTADIAAKAGVGRVTLYGHFPSRTDLVDATFGRIVTRAEERLAAVDLSGEPRQALADLIASSWEVVFQHRALLAAAQGTMPAERIRHHHEQPLTRVRSLIERGQHDGVFRTDLPTDWLVTVFYTVLHGAAGEIGAGRLDATEAASLITATILAAYSPQPARAT